MSASNRRKRLPTNVEDVVPCIQRVGSSGKRSYQTRGDKQGCSRADDIAASSVGRSPPSRTRPRPKNHQFCARPGAFTSIGSRLNLYCSAGLGRGRRGRASVRLEGSWGKVRSSESRRRNIVREGALVASGEPARAIEGADRPFAARGFSSVGYAKSGWGGTHRQLVAVLGPPPVGLRGLLPVLLTARVKGEAGTSGPMRRRARDGPVGRRRGNPRRWAIREDDYIGQSRGDGRGRQLTLPRTSPSSSSCASRNPPDASPGLPSSRRAIA